MSEITLDRSALPEQFSEIKPGETMDLMITVTLTASDDKTVTGTVEDIEPCDDMEGKEEPAGEESEMPDKPKKGMGVLIMLGDHKMGK